MMYSRQQTPTQVSPTQTCIQKSRVINYYYYHMVQKLYKKVGPTARIRRAHHVIITILL